MNTVVTILLTILIFGLIILIHELGHFLVAKASGVTVHEFALGMGPTLFKFGKKETTYAIRLFPIGGFVSMEGEDGESADSGAFCNKSILKRIAIVVAGAAMNMLLGILLLMIVACSTPTFATTTIAKFNDGAVSSTTGLQVGDKIVKINGTRIFIDRDIVMELTRDSDGIVSMQVQRDGKTATLPAVKFQVEQPDGTKGINIDFKVFPEQRSIGSVFKNAGGTFASLARTIWLSLGDLLKGNVGLKDLSGPVGVGQVVGQAAGMGLSTLLFLAAFLTINIGIFNLLPIPALDGGRLLFLLIEAVRRKPINPKYEGYIHFAGFALLIGLMVIVTFKDIFTLF